MHRQIWYDYLCQDIWKKTLQLSIDRNSVPATQLGYALTLLNVSRLTREEAEAVSSNLANLDAMLTQRQHEKLANIARKTLELLKQRARERVQNEIPRQELAHPDP